MKSSNKIESFDNARNWALIIVGILVLLRLALYLYDEVVKLEEKKSDLVSSGIFDVSVEKEKENLVIQPIEFTPGFVDDYGAPLSSNSYYVIRVKNGRSLLLPVREPRYSDGTSKMEFLQTSLQLMIVEMNTADMKVLGTALNHIQKVRVLLTGPNHIEIWDSGRGMEFKVQ